jgi:MFS family permease
VPPSAASGTSRHAWSLLALLVLLNVLNFVDRLLLQSLAPLLIRDLGISLTQLGLLFGFGFVVFYTVMGLLLGAAADRVDRPRLMAAGLAVWSTMTAVSGFAQSFVHLLVPRMLVGAGEATLTPAALSMLGEVFPARRRALAAGLYYAGVPVGGGLSLLVASYMAPRFGWRSCFFALGVVGLAFVVVVLRLRDPRRDPRARAAAGGAGPQPPPLSLRDIAATMAGAVRRSPALAWAAAGGVLLTYAAASAGHLVTWLVHERGFAFAEAAAWSGVLYATGGVAGNFLGGWFADWCEARWRDGRLLGLALLSVAFAPAGVAFLLLPPGSAAFYVAWFLTSAGANVFYGPIFAVAQDLAPPEVRATAVAFMLFALNIFGVGLGPFVTGAIGDRLSLTTGLLHSVVVGACAVVPFLVAVRARRIE